MAEEYDYFEEDDLLDDDVDEWDWGNPVNLEDVAVHGISGHRLG